MSFNKDALKSFITTLFTSLERLESEVMAYRLLTKELEKTVPAVGNLFSSVTTAVRNNPVIAEELRKKYRVPLEILLNDIDQVPSDQALQKFLSLWKPDGPTN